MSKLREFVGRMASLAGCDNAKEIDARNGALFDAEMAGAKSLAWREEYRRNPAKRIQKAFSGWRGGDQGIKKLCFDKILLNTLTHYQKGHGMKDFDGQIPELEATVREGDKAFPQVSAALPTDYILLGGWDR